MRAPADGQRDAGERGPEAQARGRALRRHPCPVCRRPEQLTDDEERRGEMCWRCASETYADIVRQSRR
jgi:hypothetical protein